MNDILSGLGVMSGMGGLGGAMGGLGGAMGGMDP